MADTEEPGGPGMGHNAVDGLPTVDKVIADLELDNKPALERVEALLERGKDFLVIDDDKADQDATEFLVKLRARYKFSEADRVAAKTPFDDLAGAVQAFFKTRILDKLGAAPSNKNEEFDPVTSDQYGMGPRITMAQTLFKRRKAAREKAEREAEAARLREVERVAAEVRAEAESKRRAEEDRIAAERREAARKAQEEADRIAEAARREAQRVADEAAAAELAASRKRNAESRAKADAEAQAARERAAALQADRDAQAKRDREAAAQREEEQRRENARVAAEREERDRLAREEENRLAQERAAAEEAASASTADLTRNRGGKGGVSSLREFVDFRDVNRELLGESTVSGINGDRPDLPSIVHLLPFIKDAALDTALKEYAKANQHTVKTGIKTGRQPLRGVVFFINTKSGGRS